MARTLLRTSQIASGVRLLPVTSKTVELPARLSMSLFQKLRRDAPRLHTIFLTPKALARCSASVLREVKRCEIRLTPCLKRSKIRVGHSEIFFTRRAALTSMPPDAQAKLKALLDKKCKPAINLCEYYGLFGHQNLSQQTIAMRDGNTPVKEICLQIAAVFTCLFPKTRSSLLIRRIALRIEEKFFLSADLQIFKEKLDKLFLDLKELEKKFT